jgi:hypothetical protein
MKEKFHYLFKYCVLLSSSIGCIKESGGERTMEFLWVRRLHVYKTTDDIIYFVLCTSFTIYVNTHACILSFSSGKIWV